MWSWVTSPSEKQLVFASHFYHHRCQVELFHILHVTYRQEITHFCQSVSEIEDDPSSNRWNGKGCGVMVIYCSDYKQDPFMGTTHL